MYKILKKDILYKLNFLTFERHYKKIDDYKNFNY